MESRQLKLNEHAIARLSFDNVLVSNFNLDTLSDLLKADLAVHDKLVVEHLPFSCLPFLAHLESKIFDSIVIKNFYWEYIDSFEREIVKLVESSTITSLTEFNRLFDSIKEQEIVYRPKSLNKQLLFFIPIYEFFHYQNFGQCIQPILIADSELRVTYLNEAAIAYLGISLGRVRKKRVHISDCFSVSSDFFFNSSNDVGKEDFSRYLETEIEVKATGEQLNVQLNIGKEVSNGLPMDRWIFFIQPVSIEVQLQDKYKVETKERKKVQGILSEKETELKQVNRLAYTDQLTQLPNYRAFEEHFAQNIVEAKKKEINIGLVMLDVDNFKMFNDQYGHKQGDIVLEKLGVCLTKVVRSIDFPARYGGEEFVIILNKVAQADDLPLFLERCRKNISELLIPQLDSDAPLQVTASLGAVFVSHEDLPMTPDKKYIDELIKSADKKLYEAKSAGRNCYKYRIWSLQEDFKNLK